MSQINYDAAEGKIEDTYDEKKDDPNPPHIVPNNHQNNQIGENNNGWFAWSNIKPFVYGAVVVGVIVAGVSYWYSTREKTQKTISRPIEFIGKWTGEHAGTIAKWTKTGNNVRLSGIAAYKGIVYNADEPIAKLPANVSPIQNVYTTTRDCNQNDVRIYVLTPDNAGNGFIKLEGSYTDKVEGEITNWVSLEGIAYDTNSEL
eukprot:7675_1